jgi:hypothetical protein
MLIYRLIPEELYQSLLSRGLIKPTFDVIETKDKSTDNTHSESKHTCSNADQWTSFDDIFTLVSDNLKDSKK